MSTSERRVILHVGVPKSGTSYLQSGLREHRKELGERGVYLPKDSHEVMFRAALDVRGNRHQWGRAAAEVDGMWERVCRRASEHEGTTILSHEILAAATTEQTARAREVLTRHAPNHRVELVLTVRDLARQLVAEWQENIKGGDTRTFAAFWERVGPAVRADDHGARFWAAQDVLDVVRRWGADLRPSQVHLVVCPPAGTDPTVLWQRYAAATRLPVTDLIPTEPELNAGLGAVEIALLREVNVALGDRLPQPRYGRAVKGALARDVLARRSSPRPVLPRAGHNLAVTIADRWIPQIRAAGWQVHGDLDELRPAPYATACHPDEVPTAATAQTGAEVIAELLVALADARETGQEQAARIEELSRQRKKLRRTRDKLRARLRPPPAHTVTP